MRLREAQGISRAELAAWTGLSPKGIERLERGANVRLDTVLRVLAGLDVPPEQIWTRIPLPPVRRKPKLNETEKAIVQLLESMGGRAQCAVKELASWIGKSPRQVYRALRRLEQLKILRIEHDPQRGRGRKNTYILVQNPLKD